MEQLLSILINNIPGIILIAIVYLYMRHKVSEVKKSSYEEGMANITPEQEKYQAHLNRLMQEHLEDRKSLSDDLEFAYKAGVIDGVSYVIKTPSKELICDTINSTNTWRATQLNASNIERYEDYLFAAEEKKDADLRKRIGLDD